MLRPISTCSCLPKCHFNIFCTPYRITVPTTHRGSFRRKNARLTPTNNPYTLNNFRTDNSTYPAINYDTDALLARLPDSIKIMLSDYANTTRLPDARATSLPMTFFQQKIPAIFSLQSQSASATEATRAFITTGTTAYAAVKQRLPLQ